MAQYRIINGRKFKVTKVATDYKPTALVIGVRPGIKATSGKVDPTMVPASHR